MADLIQVDINVKSNADEASRGLDRLQGSIVNNLKTVERLERSYKTLDAAFNKGRISAQQYAKGVQQVDRAIDDVLSGSRQATAAINQTANATKSAAAAMNQYGKVSAIGGKNLNRTNMIIQQSGYQLQDFAVQIQSGTNAFVALGQQGSQLLGVFGPKGAVLGAILAVGTAIARMGTSGKELSFDFKGFGQAISRSFEPIQPAIDKIVAALKFMGQIGVEAVNVVINAASLLYISMAGIIDIAVEVGQRSGDAFRFLGAKVWQVSGSIVKFIAEAMQTSLKAILEFSNSAVAAYVGLKDSIVAVFGLIPTAIGDLTIQAVNGIIESVEGLLNKVLESVNSFLKTIEEATKGYVTFGTVENIDIKTITNKFEGAASNAGQAISKAFSDAFNREFVSSDLPFLENFLDQIELNVEGARKEAKILARALGEPIESVERLMEAFKEYEYIDIREFFDMVAKKSKESGSKAKNAYLEAMMTAKEFADALDQQVIRAVDGVSDAFSTFLQNGMKDFKSFVGSIKDMFVKLLADMAAMALKRKILIPIATGMAAGAGSTAAAQTMASGTGSFAAGTMGATLAAGASSLGTGFMGVMTGGGLSSSFANLGGLMSGSVGGLGAIGAAIPAIAAVAVVVGLLTKKTKLLDSGLRATVDGFDVAIETFKKTQSSRLFGLLKSGARTGYEAASSEVADPLIKAIGDMQQSIVDAAGTLGIAADAFDNFSYQFKVSLKGLTEEEQLQKVNEEITKMGDSFASLSGHFETMNDLLQTAQQRYDIETRLLGLLNDQSALLTRQRDRERAATHELNRALLEQVYNLEDAYALVGSAFATVQRSIEARKNVITTSFNKIMDSIQARIDAANENVSASRGILSSLEGASGGSGMTRGAGMAYLRSLRGASRITDQKKLDDALQAIADPSQDLYTNFVDYQRDFQDQTNLVRDLEEKAALQLSTDEKTLLQLQEEAQAAQARYDSQIEKLDEQLAQAQAQLDVLNKVDTSVKSVESAISALGSAISGALAARKVAEQSVQKSSTGGGSTGKSFSEQYGTGDTYKGYDLAELKGASDVKAAAQLAGVQTSGKTGQQIIQEIANATQMAVQLDSATRAQKFAMGGMFSGGVRMVGERGPELESTGPSRIFSTKQTAELFRNPELVEEVKNLREEVAGLRVEQRQLQASNSKYVKRNYDINRKWDTEGLPATRT